MKSSLKTAIADPATGSVVWSEGDGIRVFNDLGQASVLTLVSGAGTPNAVFEGEVFKGSGDTYYAVTPSAMESSFEGGKITFSLPEEQGYFSGSYDSGACPFTATATLDGSSLNLDFSPAAGLVKFGLRGEGSVTGLTLTDKASGKAYTMTCTAPVALNGSSDTDFYFSVPAGSLSGGFNLAVTDSDSKIAIVSTEVSNTVALGSAKTFGEVDLIFKEGLALTQDGVLFQNLFDAVNHLKENSLSGMKILKDAEDENLTVDTKIVLNGGGHKLGNLLVTADGFLLVSSSSVSFKDLSLEVSYSKSGQIMETTGSYSVTGNASFDKVLDSSGKVNSSFWYAVCVPFEVKVSDIRGLDEEGNEHSMVWDKDYIVDEYDGAKRAATGKGWFDLSANSILTPGKMYIVAAIKYNTWRFYKSENAPIVSGVTQLTLEEFPAADYKNQGWNAIGNPTLHNVTFNCESVEGRIMKDNHIDFVPINPNEFVFPVSFPLYIKQGIGMIPTVTFYYPDVAIFE